jgi:hypothetical protein
VLSESRRALLEGLAKRNRNAPLTSEEQRTLKTANVYLMDFVVDGWGVLLPKIAKIEALTRPLKPAEARDLLDWFYRTAPGNFS